MISNLCPSILYQKLKSMKSQTVPFVKIAFSIVIGLCLSIGIDYHFIIATSIVLAMLIYFFKPLRKWDYCLLVTLLSYVIGYVSFHFNPFQNADQQFYEWKGVIIEKGQKFSKGMKYILQIQEVSNGIEVDHVNGKLLLLTKNSEEYQLGEVITFKGKCNAITKDDTSFWDKVSYKRGIHASVWSNQITKTAEYATGYYYLGKIQNYFENQIVSLIGDAKASALANGILLGDKSLMDKETRNEFINSGAAHILAVSGLHVSILIFFLNFVMRFIRSNKIKYSVMILFLIFYAFLTGLNPAVVRAVFMGCLALIAKMLNRNYFIVNILAFSFAFQLIIDPFLIFHLGFWLSYLAVIGIIFIQPQMIIKTKNKILNWIHDNITVGISAQIATLPIMLGFLGKFPLLFVVTNLITLPLSIIATYVGFFLMFIAEIPFLNEIVGYIARLLFSSVLITNEWIADFTYSNISFQPSFSGMLISLIILIGLIILSVKKSPKELKNSVLNII